MELHRHAIDVRFGDCDPAGVVYYPRYFDWWHQAMETWFEAVLGEPYHTVLGEWAVGFPAVETQARYRAPCRFGERVFVETRVSKVGSSSMVFDYRVVGDDGRLRATGSTSTVCVVLQPGDARHFKPTALPERLASTASQYALAHPAE